MQPHFTLDGEHCKRRACARALELLYLTGAVRAASDLAADRFEWPIGLPSPFKEFLVKIGRRLRVVSTDETGQTQCARQTSRDTHWMRLRDRAMHEGPMTTVAWFAPPCDQLDGRPRGFTKGEPAKQDGEGGAVICLRRDPKHAALRKSISSNRKREPGGQVCQRVHHLSI